MIRISDQWHRRPTQQFQNPSYLYSLTIFSQELQIFCKSYPQCPGRCSDLELAGVMYSGTESKISAPAPVLKIWCRTGTKFAPSWYLCRFKFLVPEPEIGIFNLILTFKGSCLRFGALAVAAPKLVQHHSYWCQNNHPKNVALVPDIEHRKVQRGAGAKICSPAVSSPYRLSDFLSS